MDLQETLHKVEELNEKKLKSETSFIDRAISVSTGFLAVSVTFRGSITSGAIGHVWLLQAAWGCLGVAAICGVFLHLRLASAICRIFPAMKNEKMAATSGPHAIYELLFGALLVCFPVGVALLSVFGIINVN
jgi:hypothetical protein